MQARVAGGVIAVVIGAALMHAWDRRATGDTRQPREDGGRSSRISEPTGPRPPRFARELDASQFLRGNLHTHSTRSDGDTDPGDVARWYRDHGYAFFALTDHNVLATSDGLEPWISPDFAVVSGEEVSMWVHGRQVHVNALCIRSLVDGGTYPRNVDALEHAIGAIRAQDGVALVNHPNFDWALDAADMEATRGAQLLEIASGHPYVHAGGDATHPSHERLWDVALSAGLTVMGVAVDDMHQLATDRDPEAYPGVGWVEVFASDAREAVICEALRRGALYSTTGPELRRIVVDATRYRIDPADADATVVFVGAGGRILTRVEHAGLGATYRIAGDEVYVRGRVETAHGTAWTPAVRIVSGR